MMLKYCIVYCVLCISRIHVSTKRKAESYMMKKTYENSLGQGKAVHPMRFIVMDEANHFISQKR